MRTPASGGSGKFERYGLALHALVTLAAVRVVLSFQSYKVARRAFKKWATPGRLRIGTDPWTIRYYIRRAARFVPGARCLAQALAADIVLRQAGHDPIVRIGVVQRHGLIEAHAWVMLNGRVILGDENGALDAYSVLTDLDVSPS